MAKGTITYTMRHQNSRSCRWGCSCCYSAYPFVRWCFMEANAPGDAAQAAAQLKKGKLKRFFALLIRNGGFIRWLKAPDLAASTYISKFNVQFSNLLASSTASDWMQRESTAKLKKLYALNLLSLWSTSTFATFIGGAFPNCGASVF